MDSEQPLEPSWRLLTVWPVSWLCGLDGLGMGGCEDASPHTVMGLAFLFLTFVTAWTWITPRAAARNADRRGAGHRPLCMSWFCVKPDFPWRSEWNPANLCMMCLSVTFLSSNTPAKPRLVPFKMEWQKLALNIPSSMPTLSFICIMSLEISGNMAALLARHFYCCAVIPVLTSI